MWDVLTVSEFAPEPHTIHVRQEHNAVGCGCWTFRHHLDGFVSGCRDEPASGLISIDLTLHCQEFTNVHFRIRR